MSVTGCVPERLVHLIETELRLTSEAQRRYGREHALAARLAQALVGADVEVEAMLGQARNRRALAGR